MALAWNAGWVNALRGSNPLSSAKEAPVTCHGGFLLFEERLFTRPPARSPAPSPPARSPAPVRVNGTLPRSDVCSGLFTQFTILRRCHIDAPRRVQWSIDAERGAPNYRADQPPSMVYDAPVTMPAFSEVNQPTSEATSAGSTSRLMAASVSRTFSSTSSSGMSCALA